MVAPERNNKFEFQIKAYEVCYEVEKGFWQVVCSHGLAPLQQQLNDIFGKTIDVRSRKMGSNVTHTYTLFVTTRCNLRCAYCWNALCEGEDMSLKTAKQAIHFIKEDIRKHQRKQIKICIYGGEPMLNPDIVNHLLDAFLSIEKNPDIEMAIFIYTNGTIIDPIVLNKFSQFKNRDYQISLDGTKTEHDRDRNNSWDTIIENLTSLDEAGIQKSAHPMISYPYRFIETYQTLSSLEFSFIWMQSFSYPVYRKKKSLPMDPTLWKKNYLAFCDFYLDQFGCDDFSFVMPIFSIFRTFLNLKTSPEKPCNSGNAHIAISPDGSLYPCVIAGGLETWKIGTIQQGMCQKDRTNFNAFLQEKTDMTGKCIPCPVRYYCKFSCLGNCFNKDDMSDDFCDMIREKFKIETYFLYELFGRHPDVGRQLLAEVDLI